MVYRYSAERVRAYLRTKVARLSQKDISELSRTLTRSFAKYGLMEDGKEDILKGEVTKVVWPSNLTAFYL